MAEEAKKFGWDEYLPMKKDLEKILAGQSTQQDILSALVTIVGQQAKLLQDLVTLLLNPSGNQSQVDALTESLKNSADRLAATVAANQPK